MRGAWAEKRKGEGDVKIFSGQAIVEMPNERAFLSHRVLLGYPVRETERRENALCVVGILTRVSWIERQVCLSATGGLH